MIRLFGGEPLAHKSFLPFLSALRDNFPAAELGCLSNVYRPLSFFRKLLAIDPGFSFSFSVHFEAVKEKDLLEKIAFIGSQKAPMHLQLQFLPAARERARKLVEILRRDFPDVKYSIQNSRPFILEAKGIWPMTKCSRCFIRSRGNFQTFRRVWPICFNDL